MARKSRQHPEAPQVLEEFESLGERGAAWIRDHLVLVGVGLLAVLVAAGGLGVWSAQQQRKAEAAADDLDRVRREYMLAMGATPGALEVPELANPAAAEQIRLEYEAKFAEIAEAHPGTVAGALARLAQGDLADAEGDIGTAIDLWENTLEELSGHDSVTAIVQTRIGEAYEQNGRWLEAAEAYEAAAAIGGYPLRYRVMADAVRCFAEADEVDRARVLAQRIDSEAPDLELPAHVRAVVRELRTSSN